MKKKIIIGLAIFMAIGGLAMAEDYLDHCEGSVVDGSISVMGNGYTQTTTTETCTNDDNTIRQTTITTTKSGGVSTPLGGGNRYTKDTTRLPKEYYCSTCGAWFTEIHNH